MYRVLIADHEQHSLEFFEVFFDSLDKYEIIGKTSSEQELVSLIATQNPDLLLLDINISNRNGIELAKEIKSIDSGLQIIFIASFDIYARDAYDCKICDFLLKPVSATRISRALTHFEEHAASKCQNTSIKNNNSILRFNTQSGYVLIKQDEIVWLEADQVYTKIHTIDQLTHHVSWNIGKIEPLLEASHFVKVSRSGIVNSKFISEILRTKRRCILRWEGNISEIYISKSGFHRLEKLFERELC